MTVGPESAPDVQRLTRRLAREQAKRAEAESIAERTLSELYDTVTELACSRALLDETTDFVSITDGDGHAIYVNRALCELIGIAPDPPYDVDLVSLLSPLSRERFESEALATLDAKGVWRGEFTLQRSGGLDLPVSQVLVAHRDAYGRLQRISAISRDVTEQRDLTDLLAHRALHDSLTGLPNRRLLYDRLDLALARSVRTGSSLAVLFMDLDGFKAVNDTHGHACGDTLLVAVADRLTARMRVVDTLARVGGDEFVLLCESVGSEDDAVDIADRLIAAVAQPIDLDGVTVTVGMSAGIAVSHGIAVDPEVLVRHADAAMYEAKNAGKGCFRLVVVAPT